MKTTTIGLLSSRDKKHRAALQSKAPSAAKRRAAVSGLSQDELLAKIDSLDWDETIAPDAMPAGGAAGRSPYPDHQTSSWRVAAIIAAIVCLLAIGFFLLAPDHKPRSEPDASGAPLAAAESQEAVGAVARGTDIPVEAGAAVAAADERRAALYAHAIEEAEVKAQQKTEEQRKVREARKAAAAKTAQQQERERRQRDDARARAEREAEDARLAKAREPAPVKGPSSPQEACAGEGNFFSRGMCESRACGKPEWRNHPFCQKRLEQQMPGFNQGG